MARSRRHDDRVLVSRQRKRKDLRSEERRRKGALRARKRTLCVARHRLTDRPPPPRPTSERPCARRRGRAPQRAPGPPPEAAHAGAARKGHYRVRRFGTIFTFLEIARAWRAAVDPRMSNPRIYLRHESERRVADGLAPNSSGELTGLKRSRHVVTRHVMISMLNMPFTS